MADSSASSARTPLLMAEEGGLRQRSQPDPQGERYQPPRGSDWDPNLPYGGKVYLARKKKPDPLWVRITEVSNYQTPVKIVIFYILKFCEINGSYIICHY